MWRICYARRLAAGDLIVLTLATGAAAWLRFGADADSRTAAGTNVTYLLLGGIITICWMASLQIAGTRDGRVVGDGLDEYRRVVNATVLMFGGLAIASVLFHWEMSRGYLAIAFPTGLLALVANRKLWRLWLHRERTLGRAQSKVLLVGGLSSAQEIIARLGHARESGMTLGGVWVPDGSAGSTEELADPRAGAVPVYDSARSLDAVLETVAPSVVMVTDPEHLGHHGLRDLVWRLSSLDIDLMVAPSVVDVASGRLHLKQVASMSLLHVDEPRYAEAAEWPKVIFDRVFAALFILVLSPVFITTALAVKLTSPGPVFYRQERIGLNGVPFGMVKFRSMREDADAELQQLLAGDGQAAGPLAKLKHDPRVTTVGRFIRRYSIDELPQLFNVIKGDMSLVGPRPQREFEVELYDEVAHRRLRVRPGITGLWQVSGRSDLTWEDAVRLDTYYVANWSMTTDLIILWKTARAVVASHGAY